MSIANASQPNSWGYFERVETVISKCFASACVLFYRAKIETTFFAEFETARRMFDLVIVCGLALPVSQNHC